MIKISKSLFQALQQNTYFIRGEKCILICTKKNSPSILEQLSYDNIVPIVEDGLKVKQDENLYLFKYDSLNQQQIQYMKQVFITYNIRSRNYNPKVFVYLWKMRNSLPQEEKEINQISQDAIDYGNYKVNNQRERVVKQNEYYTISDNVFVYDFNEINSSEFHQCYILRFKFYTQGLALQHKDLGYHIYYIGKAYNKSVGFYGFDKNTFSLQDVQQIAQRRTKIYKEKENKKQSSVVRQLVKIAKEIQLLNMDEIYNEIQLADYIESSKPNSYGISIVDTRDGAMHGQICIRKKNYDNTVFVGVKMNAYWHGHGYKISLDQKKDFDYNSLTLDQLNDFISSVFEQYNKKREQYFENDLNIIQNLYKQFEQFNVRHPLKVSHREIRRGKIKIQVISSEDLPKGAFGIIQIEIFQNKIYVQVRYVSTWQDSHSDDGWRFSAGDYFVQNIDVQPKELMTKMNNVLNKVYKDYCYQVDSDYDY